MFLPFLAALKRHDVPVSLREFLGFLDATGSGLAHGDPVTLYHLARTTLVKDERYFDRFDQAFAEAFSGYETITPDAILATLDLPREWMLALMAREFTDAERAEISALGGFEALLETLRQRLEDQQGRHQGGSKWIGTGGTSPFGAYGYNPEGVRIAQDKSREGRAAKVWDRREFRDLDDKVDLGSRNMKVALRRLRAWARDGVPDEFDLDGTVRATAEHGYLDVKVRPERRNAAKVLLFLDVGGSMDAHVQVAEELFSAARAEFRHLEQFYFHNCIYEGLWRDNKRRWDAQVSTADVLRTYGGGWRAILVGDASMSRYEITHPGGANEHWNAEAGAVWLTRLAAQWPKSVWLNPLASRHWGHVPSVGLVKDLVGGRMFPLTLEGITDAMRRLT